MADHPGEGVIKFAPRHTRCELPDAHYGDLARVLAAWREILVRLGHVGQDDSRYGGFGFGNLSGRLEDPADLPPGRRSFLITGSQTGAKPALSLEDFCLVERYDVAANSVDSRGLVLPSSESMTHGMIYDCDPSVRFVMHAHSPEIWNSWTALSLPTTAADVPYGTTEMARQVERLFHGASFSRARIFAMLGHEDGVIAFGSTADEAGTTLVRHAALARRPPG